MKVVVTSLPDLAKMPPQRMHQLVGRLAKDNEVTVLCTNVWWLDDVKDRYLDAILQNVDLIYVSERKVSSIVQEALFCKNFSSLNRKHRIADSELHVNIFSPLAGYWLTRKLGITTVMDLYDDFVKWTTVSSEMPTFLKPFGEPVSRYLWGKNIRLATRITYNLEALKEVYALPPEKSALIPNGVDTDLFYARDSQTLRDELGVGDDFLVGYVGGLKSWVNLNPILGALAETGGEFDLKLLVVGEEGDFKRNTDLIKARGLADKVVFTGFVPHDSVPAYISAMDVCLIPFDVNPVTEHALPLKLMEYMACEKPVISTPLKGVIEVAGDHVVYARDTPSLIRRLQELYEDNDTRRSLGRRGREFVLSNYSWDTILRHFDAVIAEAMDSVAAV